MRVIVARSNFFNLQSTLVFSIFSGNRDAKFHRNLRNAMPGWLPLDAFVPSVANLRGEPPLQVPETRSAFSRMHNKPISIVAIGVNNPDCSSLAIHACNTAPTPTGFAEDWSAMISQ